jgi:methanol--5-hydroxybenzimidazolylcobamide Co-methyltransferase
MKYNKLTITNKNDLIFGTAPHPVRTKRGLEIGSGLVYPELNFTLPMMHVDKSTFNEVKNHYQQIITEASEKAMHLYSEGVVFEFEALLEMTLNPEWGVELVKIMNDICEDNFQKHGFKSEIRLTPNDIRDFERPPRMRSGKYLENMLRLFEQGAEAGGDLLSIESTGGKEIFDDAVVMCDTRSVMFSLNVLGVRDMKFLWQKIIDIAARTGRIAGGDTACGFGNTAMVLAEKNFIPKIFAAIVRIMTAVRTLVALEQGAIGPDKDCGYEGPFLKAITGTPISMEGKTAACAHSSPLGNVSAACADLWSNESVQNIKLLGGMAPTVYMEQLIYDVRMFNTATRKSKSAALVFQELLIESDIHYDPQALILAPENVIEISKEIVAGKNYLDAAKRSSLRGLELIESAINNGSLLVVEREKVWIERIREEIQSIPDNEDQFVEEMLPMLDESKFQKGEYGL